MQLRTTIEFLGSWEQLNNSDFKGVEFDSLLYEAGSNSFTLSPTKWAELTNAKGIFGIMQQWSNWWFCRIWKV